MAAAQTSEPDVSIVTVKPQRRALVRELPGRVAPTRVSDVRPRVSGIVIERLFSQGSEVKAGDALYRIDPQPFEVERAPSEAENERATGAMRQAQAEVEGRKAEVARAKLNLSYATIRAPIDGVVGAALVSEGALAMQNETNLATIQQLDPIYADFTQSVTELNRLRRALESGELDRIAPDAVRVRLVLDDGAVYAAAGKLLFSDAKVDAHTGQVTLRGEFPNSRRELLPGMYVRVLIEQGIDADAIAVPQQAVQRNGGGGSEVFVLKDDDRVAVQAVRTGSVQDGQWFVTEGLKAGDKVVVEGFQKFAAGDKVRPQVRADADASVVGSVPGGQSTMQATR